MALHLPRFQRKIKLVDKEGYPTEENHRWNDAFAKAIENQFTSDENILADIQDLQTQQAAQLADITTLQADMAARITEISALQTDMTATINSLQTTTNNLKIGLSATQPTAILSSNDAGSNATITIANHTRIYGDGSTLAITGTALTGLSYGTLYAIYYDDPTLADTTPTFIATTTLTDAQANKATGRHFVGQITTATAGGAPTSGDGARPPSGGGPYP